MTLAETALGLLVIKNEQVNQVLTGSSPCIMIVPLRKIIFGLQYIHS